MFKSYNKLKKNIKRNDKKAILETLLGYDFSIYGDVKLGQLLKRECGRVANELKLGRIPETVINILNSIKESSGEHWDMTCKQVAEFIEAERQKEKQNTESKTEVEQEKPASVPTTE